MENFCAPEFPQRSHPVHLPVLDFGTRANLIFLTVCTKQRTPLLANVRMHGLLIDAWSRAQHWRVGRYVIMPDHIHLFCAPATFPPQPLKSWVSYWKRTASQLAGTNLWQRDFWDVQLRRHESYAAKWKYVRANPVRAKLVTQAEDWPYQGEVNFLNWVQ